MPQLWAGYVSRGNDVLLARFMDDTACSTWLSPAIRPDAPAPVRGDILVLSSTTANARVKPGGWAEADFPLVRLGLVKNVRTSPAGMETELEHVQTLHDVIGAQLAPGITEALRRSACRLGVLHTAVDQLDLTLLVPEWRARSTATRLPPPPPTRSVNPRPTADVFSHALPRTR